MSKRKLGDAQASEREGPRQTELLAQPVMPDPATASTVRSVPPLDAPERQAPSNDAEPQKVRSSSFQEMFLPVSGYVRLLPEEMAVIDHPSFQRLRRVRQLGLAHFVFPGGTHTRLEHSIGAVHASQKILDSIRSNGVAEQGQDTHSAWRRSDLPIQVEPFVRLGALLHDVGHLPFGHTLEDELNHLSKHDDTERLELVSQRPFPHYTPRIDRISQLRPAAGWTLEALINSLYDRHARALHIDLPPFEIVKAIIGKAPKPNSDKYKAWMETVSPVAAKIPLQACRDIVGNTICADFLDYLFRDWHHLGKPMFEDTRLYQYMEVREHDVHGKQFVINAGRDDRIRHDAFTNILELLEARYKLAETVLFHRTKLAIIGLFDRCLLEIGDIYAGVGIDVGQFRRDLEGELIDTADDGIFDLLTRMVAEDVSAPAEIQLALKEEQTLTNQTGDTNASLFAASETVGPLRAKLREVQRLIEHFRYRHVYTLIHKVRMSEQVSPQTPDNDVVKRMVDTYRSPHNRIQFLRGIEALCDLPAGSVVMYCPPDAKMNAKIAEVRLLVDDDVQAFNEYEKKHEGKWGLTHGALGAQIGRFHQLWSAQVYVDPTAIATWTETEKTHLSEVVKDCFAVWSPGGQGVARTKTEGSLAIVRGRRAVAARSGTPVSEVSQKFAEFHFPGGLPFSKTE